MEKKTANIEFLVHPEQFNITLEEFVNAMKNLLEFFNSKFFKIFSFKDKIESSSDKNVFIIDNSIIIQNIMLLNAKLLKLKNYDGFEEHIKNYSDDFSSAYFVTFFANLLIDKVDNIILEPDLPRKRKKPDIKIEKENESVYFECKNPHNNKKFDFFKEHKKMAEILFNHIDFPYTLWITYKNSFSEKEIYKLGETLKKRLPLVTNEGYIVKNETVEIKVIPSTIRNTKKPIEISISTTWENESKETYKGDTFFKEQKGSLTLYGPLLDYTKILRDQFRKSSDQGPDDSPYLLVISSNDMVGKISNNLKAISTAFQPERNTRFSGVLLIHQSTKSFLEEQAKVNLILNPFASYPLSPKFQRLLSNIAR